MKILQQKNLFLCCRTLLGLLTLSFSLLAGISGNTFGMKINSEQLLIREDSLIKTIQAPDTLLHFSFQPIVIEAEYPFKGKRQEKKYRQLYLDIQRTWPLARIVSNEVKMVNLQLDPVYLTKSEKKAYLKWYEKHTFNTYIDTLRSLNMRQVKLFVKLIYRETGSSPFDLVKKYRGRFDAFVWQLSANVLLVNLKKEYDPEEDLLIEDIITKLY